MAALESCALRHREIPDENCKLIHRNYRNAEFVGRLFDNFEWTVEGTSAPVGVGEFKHSLEKRMARFRSAGTTGPPPRQKI